MGVIQEAGAFGKIFLPKEKSNKRDGSVIDGSWKDAIVVSLEGNTQAELSADMSRKLHLHSLFSTYTDRDTNIFHQPETFKLTYHEKDDDKTVSRNVVDSMMQIYDCANNPNNHTSLFTLRKELEEKYDIDTVSRAERLLHQNNDVLAESIAAADSVSNIKYVHKQNSDNTINIRPATIAEHTKLQSVRTAKTLGTIIAREGVTYGLGLAILPAIHYSPLGEFAREHPAASAVASDALFYYTLLRYLGPSIVHSIKESGESLDGIATNVNEWVKKQTKNPNVVNISTYATAILTQLAADAPAHGVLLSNFLSEDHFPILHNAGNEYFLALSMVGAAVNYGQYYLTKKQLESKKQSPSTHSAEIIS